MHVNNKSLCILKSAAKSQRFVLICTTTRHKKQFINRKTDRIQPPLLYDTRHWYLLKALGIQISLINSFGVIGGLIGQTMV